MNSELPLRDIHAAVAAPWWPLSPLAWSLLAVLLIALTVVLWLAAARLARRRRQQALLNDLAALRAQLNEHQDRARLLRDVSEWLRRLLRFKATEAEASATATSGDRWQQTLLAPFPDHAEHRAAANALSEQLWRASPTFQEDQIFALAADWVNHLTRQRLV